MSDGSELDPPQTLEAWLDAYLHRGADLREAGMIGGISHQEVSNRLHELGLHVRTAAETSQLRRALAIAEHADAIHKAFLATRNLAGVAAQLGIPKAIVLAYVTEHIPDYKVLARVPRSTAKHYSNDELVASLQEAAINTVGNLSHVAYQKYVDHSPGLPDGRPRPGPQGMALRFGTWNGALEAAGLPANPTAGPPKRFEDPAAVLQSVVTCWLDLEHAPTVKEYDLWQRGKTVHPSPAIARRILGSWDLTLVRAWQIVQGVQLDQEDSEAVVPPGLVSPPEFVPYSPANEEAVLTAATEQAKSNLVELEKAVRNHSKLQNLLAAELLARGISALSPGATEAKFDVAFRDDQGALFVAEIKSCTTDNVEGQLRLGLGQVLRYAHQLRQSHQHVRPLLVTQLEPSADWKMLLAELDVATIHQDGLGEGMSALLKED